jgi:signal transduction histidine kinase/HAMP domain-containing protein
MRRRLIYSLSLLFLLFSLGTVLSMLSTHRITRDLETVITLHRIEIIRQNFVINVQSVQSNLYATGTMFGKELDTIVTNVTAMDDSIHRCLECHHSEDMTGKLKTVHDIVQEYKEAISYLVTSTANEERIERLKTVAVGIGDSLLERTQEMAAIAERSLSEKTAAAIRAIHRSRTLLAVTLVGSFILALGIAVTLTRKITRPVSELVTAARTIAAGKLGYRTEYRDDTEFGEVAESFDAMSTALLAERQQIDHYIERLSGLYEVTLSFYAIIEMEQALHDMCRSVADILKARQCILLLHDRGKDMFQPAASALELSEQARGVLCIPPEGMRKIYGDSGRLPITANEPDEKFAPLVSGTLGEKNILLAWLFRKGGILGAIRASDKEGGFTEEDVKILIILASHLAVAMENAELYRSLQDKMAELKLTQAQLIQSAKLVAIGELASNIAHEINNPLTSIIGFAELSREEDDINDMRRSLDIIEKESLRAREIVRQLLGFARKKDLHLAEVDINDVMKEVVMLTSAQARMGRVKIVEEYGDLPVITADADQLKQVFLNIVNNALSAMHGGGALVITTSAAGNEALIQFADNGPGIPPDVLHRIFEPFFTTKKDKGTGLGLSISYRIIQDHGGRIDVESREGEGSTFTVRLPLKIPVKTA